MNKTILGAAVLALTLANVATSANAGPISRACMSSDRGARSSGLCSCIQKVANQTLNWTAQRQAAKFFREPQRAQDVRMSTTQNDNDFWARYKTFGAEAERSCS